jgi:hypothetical protein
VVNRETRDGGALMAVGRISGPLLKDNLLRNGVNLAFETNLLYLDVVNSRVGINTAAPTNDLQVVGTTRTSNLTVNTQAQIASFTVSGNTIASTNSTINITPSGANGVVYQGTIVVGQLSINDSTISSSSDINLTPSGSGSVTINSNVLVNGNLHATGVITADGNIQLGDNPGDTITFTGEVNSNILPNVTNTYNLGSNTHRWNTLYANNINVSQAITIPTLNVTTVHAGNLTISGNTIAASTSNTDINLTTLGIGGISLGNFKIYNNTITNTVPNSNTVFAETGSGYVTFQGTNGIVIPSGTSTQRPVGTTGMIRFNTDLLYLETYNTNTGLWQDAGYTSGGSVTYTTAQNSAIQFALIFG